MLSMHLSEGLDLGSVASRFGAHHANILRLALQRKLSSGLVVHKGADVWTLADPDGWLVSNSIISDLFNVVQQSSTTSRRQHQAGA